MEIKYRNVCPFCQALIGIELYIDSELELDRLYTWLIFVKPLNFSHNVPFYKFIGRKLCRVCSDCWYNFESMKKFKHVRGRETMGKRHAFTSRALKFGDMDTWLKDMIKYYNRSDAIVERAPMLWGLYAWFLFPGLMLM
jgi:hypothetical protein